MDIGAAILAGLIGTAVMTGLMMVAPMMGMPRMNITAMLGTMFMEPGTTAGVVGTIIHFMMGVIFGIIYAILWDIGVGSVTVLWGVIIGLAHGVLAMVMTCSPKTGPGIMRVLEGSDLPPRLVHLMR